MVSRLVEDKELTFVDVGIGGRVQGGSRYYTQEGFLMDARGGGDMCMMITTHLVPDMQDMCDVQAESLVRCRAEAWRGDPPLIPRKEKANALIHTASMQAQNVSPGTILSPPSRSNQLSRPVVIPPNSARRGTTVLHPCANAHASLP